MGRKFIPNGDGDFATMAENFARTIAADPGRLGMAQGDSDALSAAVAAFGAALQEARFGGRSAAATRAKDDARAAAERIIRPLGHLLRSNARIDAATKILLGIRPRAQKAKTLTCPQEPPRLRFVRALHEGSGAAPAHELAFCAWESASMAKPPGAVRLELFVDLVPPEEPIPAHPGAHHGSRPWYLRSYTRSPVRLTPPMARVPMRVVYWGRWADSLGNVGPFSETAVAWIEGGSHQMLPGGTGVALGRQPVLTVEDVPSDGPEGRHESYRVAVLEVRYASMSGPDTNAAALPAPARRQARQLEGPPAEEAA